MTIKKEFHIKGKLWRVEYKWGLRHDGKFVYGLCDTENRTIYLDRAVARDEKFHWFLHELFHAICFELGLAGSADGSLEIFQEGLICEKFPEVLQELFNFRWKRGK